jgi:hypothetical protein
VRADGPGIPALAQHQLVAGPHLLPLAGFVGVALHADRTPRRQGELDPTVETVAGTQPGPVGTLAPSDPLELLLHPLWQVALNQLVVARMLGPPAPGDASVALGALDLLDHDDTRGRVGLRVGRNQLGHERMAALTLTNLGAGRSRNQEHESQNDQDHPRYEALHDLSPADRPGACARLGIQGGSSPVLLGLRGRRRVA